MKLYTYFFSTFTLLFVALSLSAQIYNRTDTLYIPETKVLPVIDGLGNEEAWEITEWSKIDQIWMPYNNQTANLGQEAGLKLWEGADDFSGRYKIIWSAETNLLYYLVETIDDVFVDGYVFPNGGYHNYDVLELFIDENRSGGRHNDANNHANAFAYHINVDAPADGEVQTKMYALDGGQSGTANYASHFKNFTLRKDGNLYTWEFSLTVHNSTYIHSNQQASVVTLEAGKIMGFSFAYCDNDDLNENPIRRDHFIGSVTVPISAHNSHWQNADWYGVAKLTGEEKDPNSSKSMRVAPKVKNYLSGRTLNTGISSEVTGIVDVRVYDLTGRELAKNSCFKSSNEWKGQLALDELNSSLYIVQIAHGNTLSTQKIFLI
jgi:hypothetical protein